MKKLSVFAIVFAIVLSLMIVPNSSSAHGVWFAQRSDRTQLVCGEGWKDSAYDPNGLVELNGFNSKYEPVDVKPINEKDYLYIEPSEDLSVVSLTMDYGYWSNTPEGKWIPKPMNEVEGSTIGTHALKYSVNYFKNVDEVKPIANMVYQLVPSVDPTKLEVGQEFTVQLLHNGEPMADTEIIPDVLNHHTVTIKTDEKGMATITASNGGLNVVGCEMTVPYENEGIDDKATRSKVFVSLGFTLYPEEDD